MQRDDLETLSKDELVDLVLKLQRLAKTSRISSKPPSTDRKEKREHSIRVSQSPATESFAVSDENPDQTTNRRPEFCTGYGHVFGDEARSMFHRPWEWGRSIS